MASSFPRFLKISSSPSLSPPSAQPPTPVDLDRAATTVVPRIFPAVTVEPAAAISSVFTESAPQSFSLLRRPNPTPEPTSAATAPASAATAPALMDHLAVDPAGSQAPASSASSVAQPVSAKRRHRPASTTDTTSTDASGSQPETPYGNRALNRMVLQNAHFWVQVHNLPLNRMTAMTRRQIGNRLCLHHNEPSRPSIKATRTKAATPSPLPKEDTLPKCQTPAEAPGCQT
ncbi:hypothetical protein L3X38_017505 [Prunus dulcis]|uniref:Uncharacterized protein n=1 Tax=Prunus dulcis TaxID=3755 RepID=A0AAD4W7E6_PRUDU|nr:hypothetical protein L3X38_017505 [Prunus dulcis]